VRSPAARIALLAAAVVAVQLAAQAAGKGFYLTQLTMAAYLALVSLGLSLLMGFAGQISLGHAAFFALGGYTAAALTTLDLAAQRGAPRVALLERLHLLVARPELSGGEALGVDPRASFLAAVALAAAVAWLVGRPVLRLRGHTLAMATLGIGIIVHSIALGTARLGAADGISGVPPFRLFPGVAVSGAREARVLNYYLAWGLVALAMALLQNLVASRVGRALRAIHGAEDAASAMGVDTARLKLSTFVLSAALAAAAGVFVAHFNGGVSPSDASVMKSVRLVAIVAVGGMGSLWGALFASTALEFLSLRGAFGGLDDAVFGAILLAVMLFSPEGILRLDPRPAAAALWRRLRPKA
jgi:branched-chain amino acid transport system permease protein